MVVLLAMLGCRGELGTEAPEIPLIEEVELTPQETLAWLTRASIDLRGVRPSVSEIEAVESDPELIHALIEDFLEDPRFGDQVMNLWSPIYLTRQDTWLLTASDFDLEDEAAWSASVGQEPLRILAQVALEDLSYTELVTADWTMADEQLGASWPVDYPADATGWQKVRYTDTRPAAGVLSTNTMWWRYMSNGSNANRARANAISRIFLCADYLTRPIEFDRNVNLLDEDAVLDAVSNNPSCVACHISLDPLGSYLWGFYYYLSDARLDVTEYHPEREGMWEDATGVSPAYYGEPAGGLGDLGWQIAGDHRYPQCAVEQVYEGLVGRSHDIDDADDLTELREIFLADDMKLRALFRGVVNHPDYMPLDREGDHVPRKLISPERMASQVEALTGFRFTSDGFDMMETDTYGLRTLAGGVDGGFVTRPSTEPTATWSLVMERLSQAAARSVVDTDQDDLDTARLFIHVDFSELPETEPEAMVEQIQHLHLALFGHRVDADGPEVEANMALWSELYEAEKSAHAAWAGLLSVLMRDPDFTLY